MLGGLGGALFAGGFAICQPDQFSFAELVVLLTMALLGGAQRRSAHCSAPGS